MDNTAAMPKHPSARAVAAVVDVRPVRQLSRRDTQREAALNPTIYRDRWQTGPFADAPDKRAFGSFGPCLLTTEHKNLIGRMRLEGARLSQAAAEAQREATIIHVRHVATWRKLHETRDELRQIQDKLAQAEADVQAAKVVFSDLDTIYAISQQHRISRIAAAKQHEPQSVPSRQATPDLYPRENRVQDDGEN